MHVYKARLICVSKRFVKSNAIFFASVNETDRVTTVKVVKSKNFKCLPLLSKNKKTDWISFPFRLAKISACLVLEYSLLVKVKC